MQYFLGIDVGTGSARAGIFDLRGRMAAMATQSIQMWKPAPDHVEQSSEDIWRACCRATRMALRQAGLKPAAINGIGFDATCSLVALNTADRPVSLSTTGRPEQNIIVWMDHRAVTQAERINRTRHPVLRYVGGVISPEMQTPKLLWLKENLPAAWRSTARFFDLPDFLTYRATSDDTRSLCTTVCKWTYLGHRGPDGAGWSNDFFTQIGLGDLMTDGFRRIGQRVRPMGQPLGQGLTARAAKDLGLLAGTPVGVAIIDAHAGGLGLLGAKLDMGKPTPVALNRRLALIGGTSSCHMAVSAKPRFIRGIWGPYHSAMIPGLWLNEGGQSATGALIDHVIFAHSASIKASVVAKKARLTIYEFLNRKLAEMTRQKRLPFTGRLTEALHIQPDFHGNRSPRADPSLRGTMTGLSLSATIDDLAIQYLAAIQAVAHGTRHIIESLNRQGYRINTLMICGGGTKNPLFIQQHADITGCRIVHPREAEAVLLGAALLGAVAAGAFSDLSSAMSAMNCAGKIVHPATGSSRCYHAAKHRVFHRLYADSLAYRRLMRSAG